MNEFSKLGLNKKILEVLAELRFFAPTDIQEKAIPLVLKGDDVIGNAATGSGKTLAFASGIIEKCLAGKGVQALVLAPTRELAEQIAKVMRTFAKNYSLKILDVFGGVSMNNQVRDIKHSEVIVGTPGRILDHLSRNTLDLSNLKVLVLDEADRMADMGFLPDVESIIGYCPKERQTLLFTATLSQDINYLEKRYMRSPKHVIVEQYIDASQLEQSAYITPTDLKFSLLVYLIKKSNGISMIFCNTRRNVDLLSMNLKRYGINSMAVHGGLDQKKRSRVIENLHIGQNGILVCTDVAARGLDIKNVNYVYNYDMPKTSEEYIHRIGRTARAGNKGVAISLVSNNDFSNFRNILEDDSLKIEQKELPQVERLFVNFKRNIRFKNNNFRRNTRRLVRRIAY